MNSIVPHLVHAVEDAVVAWDNLHAGRHERGGGREFLWDTTEIGHIHWNGDVDMLFNVHIRKALVEAGITETHKWIPQSGWTTFRLHNETDVQTAVQLLRLSYLQKRIRKSSLAEEQLVLADELRTLPFPADVLHSAEGGRQTHNPTATDVATN